MSLASLETPLESPESAVSVDSIKNLAAKHAALREQIAHAVVGQHEVIDGVLLTIFCGGHALLTGVPGLAKTLLVRTLAQTLHMYFSRIQFTPDLMPSDITGTDIIEEDAATGKRKLEFLFGPVFANLLLADEINRTPPKTQAALLQVMQEKQVTIGSKTYNLPAPFHVVATQNPIEQEGTYVLPEAQADRFMFGIRCGYPTLEEEVIVVRQTTANETPVVQPVLSGPEILEIQKLVRAMPVSDEVIRFAVQLVNHTRPEEPGTPQEVRDYVRCGGSPRASQYLVLGAKARAALDGRFCAEQDDVRSVAQQVLGHRVLLNFRARAEKVDSSQIIQTLLDKSRS